MENLDNIIKECNKKYPNHSYIVSEIINFKNKYKEFKRLENIEIKSKENLCSNIKMDRDYWYAQFQESLKLIENYKELLKTIFEENIKNDEYIIKICRKDYNKFMENK